MYIVDDGYLLKKHFYLQFSVYQNSKNMSIDKFIAKIFTKASVRSPFGGFMMIELMFSILIIICSTLLIFRYNSAIIVLNEDAYCRMKAIDYTASLMDKISYHKQLPKILRSQEGRFSSEIHIVGFDFKKARGTLSNNLVNESEKNIQGFKKLSIVTRWKSGAGSDRSFKIVAGVFLDH